MGPCAGKVRTFVGKGAGKVRTFVVVLQLPS